MKKLLTILLILALMITPVYAITASLGNSRAIIDYELKKNGSNVLQREIEVNNVNDYPIKVTFEAIDGFKGITTFPTAEVILKPNTSQDVPFTVQFSQPGVIDGKINVYFIRNDGVKESPAVLRATYTVLVSGEGQPIPTVTPPPTVDSNKTDIPDQNETDAEAPRTFEDKNATGTGTVGVKLGDTLPTNDNPTPMNWFMISFIGLIVIAIILGVIYALRK